MRHTRLTALGLTTAVAVAALLSGCTAKPQSASSGSRTDPEVAGTSGQVLSGAGISTLLRALPQRSVGPTPTMHLKAGLVPPTNRWYSGLVFGAKPQPVFPFPLAFRETASGFTAALPSVTATANTIASGVGAGLSVNVHATSAQVSAYDEVSVTLEHLHSGKPVGFTTIAEGSPLTTYRAATDQTVALSSRVTTPPSAGTGAGTVTVDGRPWGVRVMGGNIQGASVHLNAHGTLVLFPFPDSTSAAERRTLLRAAAPLKGVHTTYSRTPAEQRTTLTYTSTGASRTLVVPLPHQHGAQQTGCTRSTYSTVYGVVPMCTTKTIAFTTPTIKPRSSLNLTNLTTGDRAALTAQLRKDVAANPPFAADTYFGGKTLYRSAMLLQLARQLHDDTSAKTLTTRLTTSLDQWTQPGGCTQRGQNCFVYDPKLHTVVGLANSFGSEQDNDHHFHYGYILYAAGVVAAGQPNLAKRWAPVLNLLAADIAARQSGPATALPTTRVYDPYFSHSWASGSSPFADGNNQESSSEAINAWTGLSLWAAASKDKPLAAEAAWMLSGETTSALAYWIHPDLSSPAMRGFSHAMVSLNWGDKRDFATWFSAAPSAIVGIQLIPMSPVSSYLRTAAAGGAAQIKRLTDAAAPAGYAVPLGDYLLMYRSLAGKSEAQTALTEARKLPTSAIDNGDSRTYLEAYILSNMRH